MAHFLAIFPVFLTPNAARSRGLARLGASDLKLFRIRNEQATVPPVTKNPVCYNRRRFGGCHPERSEGSRA
jgi:hypothetical protein